MSDCTSLYTKDELIAKLKELDTEMDSAETQSKIDSSQSSHEYRLSQRTLREQYEKYAAMLQRVDPECYRTIFGSSVINFRGNSCR